MISRNIAYRLWISDINNSNYVKSLGEFEPNYIEFRDKKISRVNIIAIVINKYETGNYSSILVEDGSSQISVKSWNEDKKIVDKAGIGDVIIIVGKIRQNTLGAGFYIQPEIIRKVDERWMLARRNELEKEYGKPNRQDIEEIGENPLIEEVIVSEKSLRNKILNVIEDSSNDDGASKQEILQSTNSPMTFEAINELLKEGEIFEVNGRDKLLR